jgi:hypothetical protein
MSPPRIFGPRGELACSSIQRLFMGLTARLGSRPMPCEAARRLSRGPAAVAGQGQSDGLHCCGNRESHHDQPFVPRGFTTYGIP